MCIITHSNFFVTIFQIRLGEGRTIGGAARSRHNRDRHNRDSTVGFSRGHTTEIKKEAASAGSTVLAARA